MFTTSKTPLARESAWLRRLCMVSVASLLVGCLPPALQNHPADSDDCDPVTQGDHDKNKDKGGKHHDGDSCPYIKGKQAHDKGKGDGDDKHHDGDDSHHDGDDDHHGHKTKTRTSTSTKTSTKCNVGSGTSTSTGTNTSTSTSTSTGYNFPNMPGRTCTVDRFRQASDSQTIKKVDILFMMDHSGSMADDWERVANNMQELVKQLPADADVRYGVVLGDVGYWRGKLYAPSKTPLVLDNQKMSVQEISNNLHKIFVEGMKVTDNGSGEALFHSLYSAVTDQAKNNQKAGFFRPDAALSVIFMSDEQEIGFPFPSHATLASQGLPVRCDEAFEEGIKNQYYDRLGVNVDSTFYAVKYLKGDMPVRTHAFVNLTKEDLFKRNSKNAKCLYDSLGYGYLEMVAKTKGVLYSIQDNKAEGLAKCGQVIRESLQLQHDFKLSQPADQVDAATILAAVDSVAVASTFNAALDSVHLDNAGQANSLVEIGYCAPAPTQQPPQWGIGTFMGTPGQTSVNLQWTTPGYATAGKILWGTSANNLTESMDDPSTSASHNLTVSGLNPNTVYYFQAVSWDGFGQIQQSPVLSYRTLPAWNLNGFGGQPSSKSLSVQWNTPEYATKGQVAWGPAPNALTNQVNDAVVATAHNVVVNGLDPATTYYVQAVSTDEFGQQKSSAVVPLTTLVEWGIVSFSGTPGLNSVSLSWSTPELATAGKVLWGTSPGALSNSVPEGATGNSHSVDVNGLSPNTDYYFQAVSTDNNGLQKSSSVIMVHTLTDWAVSGFSGTPDVTSVSLAWNTTQFATSGKVLWGTTATGLTNVMNDAVIGTAHTVNVTGLIPNTVYYFQAVSNDSQGFEHSSAVTAITTLPEPTPLPTWTLTNFAGSGALTSVTLTWATSEYATSGKVVWGNSQTALNNTVNEAGVLNNHSVTVSGLSPNTIYYFQAVSTDDQGQEQQSAVIPVSTLQDNMPPPPPTDWTVQGLDGTTTASSATIIWQTAVPAKATLLVGTDPSNLTLQSIDLPAYSTSQLVEVTGLNPSTTYYFQVIAVDQSGTTQASVVLTKTTKAQ